MNEIYQKIVDIIVDAKGIDPDTIHYSSTFQELNVDSLDIAEMTMTLEDEFGITIELEEGVNTIEDLVNLIMKRMKA
ncbi:MAG: acyl carrier protein [Clostridia bacterium]|nr:acyl carrier protein [Clostridia bacterium]MBQ6122595.1 acyl carrier protein [Clostridia bacterium]MBQ6324984.1 acyl carrier protein [Clostridia bacterium]MBQ6348730.1 acyl carrier protein [Clostridia bacterium]MBQ9037938.1 acyl carrier protein [Clostridia bacterium]